MGRNRGGGKHLGKVPEFESAHELVTYLRHQARSEPIRAQRLLARTLRQINLTRSSPAANPPPTKFLDDVFGHYDCANLTMAIVAHMEPGQNQVLLATALFQELGRAILSRRPRPMDLPGETGLVTDGLPTRLIQHVKPAKRGSHLDIESPIFAEAAQLSTAEPPLTFGDVWELVGRMEFERYDSISTRHGMFTPAGSNIDEAFSAENARMLSVLIARVGTIEMATSLGGNGAGI